MEFKIHEIDVARGEHARNAVKYLYTARRNDQSYVVFTSQFIHELLEYLFFNLFAFRSWNVIFADYLKNLYRPNGDPTAAMEKFLVAVRECNEHSK